MQPSTLSPRARVILALAVIALLCIVSLGESFKTLSSSSIIGRAHDTHQQDKRNWESELSPFSGRPDDIDDRTEDDGPVDKKAPEDKVDPAPQGNSSAKDGDDKFGIPKLSLPVPLPVPVATPLSIIASIFGGHDSSGALVPGIPTPPSVPAPTGGSGGGMFGSVLSILAGSPSATLAPGSPGGSTGPLGGLLSALSQAAPSPIITPPPVAPTGSGGDSGPLAGLNVLDGVASALGGVLGGSDGTNGGGDGLMGQLSANILNPLSSIVADPAAILANPTAAISNLQSQVSAVLNGMPSAMAAGLQLASNVGGDIADALNATNDVLDGAPAVAGGVADQVGSLLNAGPALATGLPAAAMAAVDQIGGILNGVPGVDGTITGLLDEMKNDLSNAAANAGPQMSAMAEVIGSQVAGVLPSELQPLVAAAVASQQTAAPGPPTQAGLLGSLLSSLSSSIVTAAPTPTDSAAVESMADSALSGLSSLISHISQLSLTAATTPASVAASTTSSPDVAQTTIYYVQTITALMTSTATQTSIVTMCPSAFSSYMPSAYPSLGGSGSSGGSGGLSGSSGTGTDGSKAGPCPGQGYTCSDCLDGWFCPPFQTPAAQVPCGYGWPCYHCKGGFFCVPAPQAIALPAPVHAHSTPPPQAAIPTNPPTTSGYQYVGCYQDNPGRSLRDAQLLGVGGGMTNGQCVDFCQTQDFAIAGTEDGSQCFCGTLLLDSIALGEEQCSMGCSGDATNSTTCGGSWALSIWTVDGKVQQAQGQSPRGLLTSEATPSRQNALAIKSKFDAATAVYAWPPFVPAVSTGVASLALMNSSNLGAVILAATAAEASGLAPSGSASASGITESVSMSSIASELSLAVPASNTALISGPTNLPLEPGPVILSTTLQAFETSLPVTAAAAMPTTGLAETIPVGGTFTDAGASSSEGADADAADDEGSYVFPTISGITTQGATRAGRAHRRMAGFI